MKLEDAQSPEANSAELTETLTPVSTPVPTPAAKKRNRPAPGAAPSDKTVIKQLRDEVKKLTEQNVSLIEELETQINKNTLLFKEMDNIRMANRKQAERDNEAREILYTGLNNLMRSFNAIR